MCNVGSTVYLDFLILHALWCHFCALFGFSLIWFPLSGVTCGLAADWIGPLLNLSFSAWDSKICFSCDSYRDLGHWSCRGFLVYLYVCVHKVLAMLYCFDLLFILTVELSCVVALVVCDGYVILSSKGLCDFVQVSTPCVLLKYEPVIYVCVWTRAARGSQ